MSSLLIVHDTKAPGVHIHAPSSSEMIGHHHENPENILPEGNGKLKKVRLDGVGKTLMRLIITHYKSQVRNIAGRSHKIGDQAVLNAAMHIAECLISQTTGEGQVRDSPDEMKKEVTYVLMKMLFPK